MRQCNHPTIEPSNDGGGGEVADFLYELKLHDPSTGMVGYIAIKDLVNGIAGGGLRVGPEVSLGEVKRLAEVMSKKWMAMAIGFGGAKAGIKAMATAHNKRELLTSFARLAKPLLSSVFFTGPDMGTTHAEVSRRIRRATREALEGEQRL